MLPTPADLLADWTAPSCGWLFALDDLEPARAHKLPELGVFNEEGGFRLSSDLHRCDVSLTAQGEIVSINFDAVDEGEQRFYRQALYLLRAGEGADLLGPAGLKGRWPLNHFLRRDAPAPGEYSRDLIVCADGRDARAWYVCDVVYEGTEAPRWAGIQLRERGGACHLTALTGSDPEFYKEVLAPLLESEYRIPAPILQAEEPVAVPELTEGRFLDLSGKAQRVARGLIGVGNECRRAEPGLKQFIKRIAPKENEPVWLRWSALSER